MAPSVLFLTLLSFLALNHQGALCQSQESAITEAFHQVEDALDKETIVHLIDLLNTEKEWSPKVDAAIYKEMTELGERKFHKVSADVPFTRRSMRKGLFDALHTFVNDGAAAISNTVEKSYDMGKGAVRSTADYFTGLLHKTEKVSLEEQLDQLAQLYPNTNRGELMELLGRHYKNKENKMAELLSVTDDDNKEESSGIFYRKLSGSTYEDDGHVDLVPIPNTYLGEIFLTNEALDLSHGWDDANLEE